MTEGGLTDTLGNVVVTGATGFIGRRLCRDLAAAGARVTGVARRDADLCCDLGRADPDQLARRLEGAGVVFHLAGLAHRRTPRAALDLANVDAAVTTFKAAARAGVQRFVLVSSIKALGETSSRPLPADAPARPADAYGRSKRAAELAVLQAAADGPCAAAVVRPPLVYGPGVGANFLRLMAWVAAGRPFPAPRGAGARSLVGVGNLTALMIAIARVQPAERIRGVWHVADSDDVTVPALVGELAALLRRPARLVPLPDLVVQVLGRVPMLGRAVNRLFAPLQICQAATTERLSWSPPYARRTELEDTVSWFLGRS